MDHAWSGDEKVLAVMFSGQRTVLLDTATWKPVVCWAPTAPGRSMIGDLWGNIAFLSDGRFVAPFGDGFIRELKPPFEGE